MTEKSVGIPIERERLNTLADDYLRRMDTERDSLTVDDYVTMVRLFNTIELGRLRREDPLLDRYATAFFPGHVATAAGVLGLTPTKGMALYSAGHDLYLGGPPHTNSRYSITD
jgi:hypothetical protein